MGEEYNCSPLTKSRGFTKLMHMVMSMRENENYDELKEHILKYPNELDAQNEKGWTALILAVRNYKTCSTKETVMILVELGCDVNIQENGGSNALIVSWVDGVCVEIVKLLLDNGAKVNVQNKNGWSYLISLCRNCFTNCAPGIVSMLLDSNCDIDLQVEDGWTALMMICRYYSNGNSFKMAKLLLDNNCDVNLQNKNGSTALMLACRNCFDRQYMGIILLLLDNGSDWNVKNWCGKTAFDMLGSNPYCIVPEIMRLFIDRGYDWKGNKYVFSQCCIYNKSTAKWMLDMGYEMGKNDVGKFISVMKVVVDEESFVY